MEFPERECPDLNPACSARASSREPTSGSPSASHPLACRGAGRLCPTPPSSPLSGPHGFTHHLLTPEPGFPILTLRVIHHLQKTQCSSLRFTPVHGTHPALTAECQDCATTSKLPSSPGAFSKSIFPAGISLNSLKQHFKYWSFPGAPGWLGQFCV